MFLRGLKGVERVLVKQPAPFMAVVRRQMTHAVSRVEVKVTFTKHEWLTGKKAPAVKSVDEDLLL